MILGLFWAMTAHAADPTIELPPGEPVSLWREPLALAGMSPSTSASPTVRVVVIGGRWSIELAGAQGTAPVQVPAPTTPSDREAIAWLASSLAAPLDLSGLPPSVPPVAAPASPPPAPAVVRTAASTTTAAAPVVRTGAPAAAPVVRTAAPAAAPVARTGATASAVDGRPTLPASAPSAAPVDRAPALAASAAAQVAPTTAPAAILPPEPATATAAIVPPEPATAAVLPSEPAAATAAIVSPDAAPTTPTAPAPAGPAPLAVAADTPPAGGQGAAGPPLDAATAVADPPLAVADTPVPAPPDDLPARRPARAAPAVQATLLAAGGAALQGGVGPGASGRVGAGLVLLEHLSVRAAVSVSGPSRPTEPAVAEGRATVGLWGTVGWEAPWTWAPSVTASCGGERLSFAQEDTVIAAGWIPSCGAGLGLHRALPGGLSVGLEAAVQQELRSVWIRVDDTTLDTRSPTKFDVAASLRWRSRTRSPPE